MKTKLAACCLASMIAVDCCASARAAGLIERVPDDGGWVSYRWTSQRGAKNETGGLTISTVGSETIQGQPCRWLELKVATKQNDVDHTLSMKVLVPETELRAKNSELLAHAHRRLFRLDDATPVETLSPADAPDWLGQASVVLQQAFMPLRVEGKLEDKLVQFQDGQLKCAGRKETDLNGPAKVKKNGQAAELVSERTVWTNETVPFGVAACECRSLILHAGKSDVTSETTFLISGRGSDAKSAFPKGN